jgi:undecaprenyl-diphosphatase
MREYIEAILLGIVQGLTEFLPISSSGHLEILKFILGDQKVGEFSLFMTVILHGATALATVWVFREKVWKVLVDLKAPGSNDGKRFFIAILISMIPAVIVGLMLEDFIASMFEQDLRLVGSALLVTALFLWLADRVKTSDEQVNWSNGFIIGLAQMIAIIPGISRSGATIAASLLLKVERDQAAQFSFLMVVPLILGKILRDLFAVDWFNYPDHATLIAGFFAAFISGWFACKFMVTIIRKSNLSYFSIYCLIVGLVAILFGFGILRS